MGCPAASLRPFCGTGAGCRALLPVGDVRCDLGGHDEAYHIHATLAVDVGGAPQVADPNIGLGMTPGGELVLTGVPVFTIVDIGDPWVTFSVREDQFRDLKIGAIVRGDVPALGLADVAFRITAINPQGEFATWRSTRQSSGYDVRSFQVKAKPVRPVNGLRPGMSVLFDWSAR